MSVLLDRNKESRMGPRVSVCRKGENIFLTIEGDINFESSQELLAVVRKLMNTLMKCAAPETRVNYRLKTRATVNLDKMAHFQEAIAEQTCSPEVGGKAKLEQERAKTARQGESARPRTRNGLTLVRGGAS
jgi:hypothetical protein